MFGLSRHNGEGTNVLNLRDEMDRLFGSWFREFPLASRLTETMPVVPSLDVTETDNEVRITAELPGMKATDVDVTVDDHTLVLKGEKKSEHEEKTETMHRVERSYGSFRRVVTLPAEVDNEKVNAAFKDGVLTITLPKTKEAKAHSKKVKIHSA
ncbi:MAG: Hsp20/alpha crystallin family protein [Planctomycetota bacterium]